MCEIVETDGLREMRVDELIDTPHPICGVIVTCGKVVLTREGFGIRDAVAQGLQNAEQCQQLVRALF